MSFKDQFIRWTLFFALMAVFGYQCLEAILKLSKWDIGTVRTRQTLSRMTYPSMTFCPYLNAPIGYSRNLTEFYENLTPLKDILLYGKQGMDPKNPDYLLFWNSAPEFSFDETIIDEVCNNYCLDILLIN